MKTAPWLFVRGNHELCSRAGPGWFYLLDPASALLGGARDQESCPPQTPAGWQPGAWPKPPALPFEGQPFPVRISPPMRLKLGELDIISHRFGQRRRCLPLQPRRLCRAVPAGRRHPGRATADLAGHPSAVLGRGEKDPGRCRPASEPYGFINVTQQAALAKAFPNGLPSNVTAVLSGHMHRFQAIGFGDRRPPQLIVGTAGIVLSHVQPAPPSPDDKRPILVPKLDGIDAEVVGLMDHGAMVLEPGKAGAWIGAMVSETGRVLATCDSSWPRQSRSRSVCRLQ